MLGGWNLRLTWTFLNLAKGQYPRQGFLTHTDIQTLHAHPQCDCIGILRNLKWILKILTQCSYGWGVHQLGIIVFIADSNPEVMGAIGDQDGRHQPVGPSYCNVCGCRLGWRQSMSPTLHMILPKIPTNCHLSWPSRHPTGDQVCCTLTSHSHISWV